MSTLKIIIQEKNTAWGDGKTVDNLNISPQAKARERLMAFGLN